MSISQRLRQPVKVSMLALALVGSSVVSANLSANEISQNNTVAEQHQKHKKGMKQGHHKKSMAKMFKRLGLSDEQKVQMKALKEQAKADKSQYQEQLASYKTKRHAIMSAAEFDEVAFSNLAAEYQGVFAELALLKAKNRFAIKAILTEEQLAKLEKFKNRKGHGRKS